MRDPEATVSTPTEPQEDFHRCIALRILAHPDPRRVGDFAPLFDAGSIGTAEVNRFSPDFRAPDGRRTGPLVSARVTRKPLQVEYTGHGLQLRNAGGSKVEVNGRPLVSDCAVSSEDLETGLVILFGKYLALWLGWFDLIEPAPPVPGLVGESTAMRRLRQQVHRIADTDVPVLLRGETGVGKELVAAAIHGHSKRARSEYVAVNLAGIPPTIAASELFGHRRGAFSGAVEDRKGYFLQANGGTLFLDEIGDVSAEVQTLLLRAIQQGVIQPLGGGTLKVDVRLIAATDSDLEAAIARREFREPLLRRFAYEIRVPPLRERRDDTGLLFYHLLRDQLETMRARERLVSATAETEGWVPAAFVADLALHDWSGNVREMVNVALQFAIENRDRVVGRVTDDLRRLVHLRRSEAPKDAPAPREPSRLSAELSDAELVAAVRAEKFSPERAAKRLGISKSYLYKRLSRIPDIRRISEISHEEIRAALTTCRDDVRAAAERLQVSQRALRLRLKDLGPSRPLR